jgi:CO dehydrogenase/acetyl-CoA synthase beta subunit
MDKDQKKKKPKVEVESEGEEEVQEEEQKEDQIGEDFVKDIRVLTYTTEAGKLADGKLIIIKNPFNMLSINALLDQQY